MAMSIPVIPSLPAGHVVTAAEMNKLAYACTFLLGKPIARVEDTNAAQALTTSATTITFGSPRVFDTDGMWNAANPNRLTVQTPGWYKLRYHVNGTNPSGQGILEAYAQSTTGANNPLPSFLPALFRTIRNFCLRGSRGERE